MKFSDLKEKAKALIKENYWMAVGIALLPLVIPSLLESLAGSFSGLSGILLGGDVALETIGKALAITSAAFALVELVIKPHLQTFVAGYFLSRADGEEPKKLSSVIDNGMFLKILFAKLLVSLKIMLYEFPAFVLLYAAAIIGTKDGSFPQDGAPAELSTPVLVLLCLGLIAVVVAFVLIIMYSYSVAMIPYIFNDQQYDSAEHVIRRSKTMMKGHRFELFRLELSFILWILLGIFTGGLLYCFWVDPYYEQTRALYYRALPFPELPAEPAKPLKEDELN